MAHSFRLTRGGEAQRNRRVPAHAAASSGRSPRWARLITADLEVVEQYMGMLVALAQRWASPPATEDAYLARVEFARDWAEAVGQLKVLDDDYRHRDMTDIQQAAYVHLLRQLAQAEESISRLELQRPPEVVIRRARRIDATNTA